MRTSEDCTDDKNYVMWTVREPDWNTNKVYFRTFFVSSASMMFNGVGTHEEHLKSAHLFDVVHTAQPPASRQCPEDLHLAVLPFGEALVLAALACGTNLWMTFIQQHAVDAL